MIEVIEHCGDPFRYLTVVSSPLKLGGILFLTMPNIESRAFVNKGKEWRVIGPYGYIYYLSPRTLRMMLEKATLRLLELRELGRRRGTNNS